MLVGGNGLFMVVLERRSINVISNYPIAKYTVLTLNVDIHLTRQSYFNLPKCIIHTPNILIDIHLKFLLRWDLQPVKILS